MILFCRAAATTQNASAGHRARRSVTATQHRPREQKASGRVWLCVRAWLAASTSALATATDAPPWMAGVGTALSSEDAATGRTLTPLAGSAHGARVSHRTAVHSMLEAGTFGGSWFSNDGNDLGLHALPEPARMMLPATKRFVNI